MGLLIKDILKRLEKVRVAGWSKHKTVQYTALCPAHPDRINSLSITTKGKGVLVHCHAGCSYEKVMAALGEAPTYGPPRDFEWPAMPDHVAEYFQAYEEAAQKMKTLTDDEVVAWLDAADLSHTRRKEVAA